MCSHACVYSTCVTLLQQPCRYWSSVTLPSPLRWCCCRFVMFCHRLHFPKPDPQLSRTTMYEGMNEWPTFPLKWWPLSLLWCNTLKLTVFVFSSLSYPVKCECGILSQRLCLSVSSWITSTTWWCVCYLAVLMPCELFYKIGYLKIQKNLIKY